VSRLDPRVSWYLAAPHVAPFTVGAKGARRLAIRAAGNAAAPAEIEYVYDLAGAGRALERLPCARGTPTAGRPLPYVEPPNEGTYAMPAVEEQPRIRNRAEIDRLLEERFPPELRATGGRVVVRYRVLQSGRVDSASVTVTESTHEALSELARMAVRRLVHTPARIGAWPVVVWVEVPLTFAAKPVEADSAVAPPPRS
jgi:TonB family protein